MFVWWNPQREEIERKTVPGLNVNVVEATPAVSPPSETDSVRSSVWMYAIAGLFALGLVSWLVHKPASRLIETWQTYYNRSEAVTQRKLRAACASNDAHAAYARR